MSLENDHHDRNLIDCTGSALISWEKGIRFRQIGIVFAIATSLTFAIRDVVARHFNVGTDVSSWWSGTVVLIAASITLRIFRLYKIWSYLENANTESSPRIYSLRNHDRNSVTTFT